MTHLRPDQLDSLNSAPARIDQIEQVKTRNGLVEFKRNGVCALQLPIGILVLENHHTALLKEYRTREVN
jgi:hypothetical protein